MKLKKIRGIAFAMTLLFALSAVGCAATQTETSQAETSESSSQSSTGSDVIATTSSIVSSIEGSVLETTQLFSERDLVQEADLTNAVEISLVSNEDTLISEEGVYVLTGQVENVTVTIEAAEDAKVQIVLDGVTITNGDAPAIYVKAADKVFVTTTSSENTLEVTGSFVADGETNLDAAIFSKSDLTLNGIGTLNIISNSGNGVTSKDDLIITGGIYNITSAGDGLEAKDAIGIYDGEITVDSGKDALHSENEEDNSLGSIYMQNGTLNITAVDDAIHATSVAQIDGGTINITTCTEGIEGTYVQINGGDITLYATDDGINASAKSTYDVMLEVNGGTINVSMGDGDTDAFDSNGSIEINGGTITVEATSAFDSDGTASLNGGDVTVNGEKITEITQMQMGGGGRGGNGGSMKPGF